MTLKELKEKVDHYYNMGESYHTLQVCIPNNEPGMGGTSVTNVDDAIKGIDWDSRKFMLFPESPMTEIPIIDPIK